MEKIQLKKTDFQDVKKNNRKLVLSCLSDGCRSRSDIVKISGLSKAAISLITNEFIEEGCIIEKQILPSGGNVGRPSIELELVPDFCFFAGVTLFRKKSSICVVNQCSELIDYTDFYTENFSTADSLLECLWDELLKILNKNNIPQEKLMGIGVVAPAPFDNENGIILTPPNFPLFQNYNIKDYFKKKTDRPVFLDKNSVLLAITDAKLRNSKFNNSLFIFASHDGIGAAIITDNQTHKGFGYHSGELGHTSVEPEGPQCECGNIGCLEKVLSSKYLEEKFGYSCSYAELVDLCYDGDKKALSVLDYIASKLSFAIINAVNLIDLDAVIIHGTYNYRSEMLFSKIESNVKKHSLISNVHPVEILPSLISPKDKISSSTSSIIKAYFDQKL